MVTCLRLLGVLSILWGISGIYLREIYIVIFFAVIGLLLYVFSYRFKYRIIRFNVANTTVKNYDGDSRQWLLKKIFLKQSPFNKRIVPAIKYYEDKSNPAYAVYVNHRRIGDIPSAKAVTVQKFFDRYDKKIKVRAYYNSRYHIYGAVIKIKFNKYKKLHDSGR